MRRGDALHALQSLEAALRLARLAGLGAKALYERLHVPDLALLARVEGRLLRQLGGALLLERGVIAAVGARPAVLDVHHPVDHAIEELPVVRDQEQRARIRRQPALQPHDGIEVQVVGRLVQQQQVGAAHQRPRHVQPHPPAARERAHRPALIVAVESQPVHQRRRAAGGVIAADGRVAAVQVAELHAVIGLFGPCQCGFDRAQLRIPIQHELDRLALAGIQLLRHIGDRQLRGHVETAALGRELATHQFQQARLAAAVLAGDADLLAAKQAEGGALEQHAFAAAQA